MSLPELELCEKCKWFARTGEGELCPECLKKIREYESKYNCICDIGLVGDQGPEGCMGEPVRNYRENP